MGLVPLRKKHRASKVEGGKAPLGTISTVTTSDWVETFGYLIKTIEIINGATNGVTFTVEGGFKYDDGTAEGGIRWYTLATRADSSASFATTGRTVTGSSKAIYEISPTPVVEYIRVNVSTHNANGTQFILHVEL